MFVEFRPGDPEGYESRALAHIRSGNEAEAKPDLEKADKLKAKKK
jgi:hypothetical protein